MSLLVVLVLSLTLTSSNLLLSHLQIRLIYEYNERIYFFCEVIWQRMRSPNFNVTNEGLADSDVSFALISA